MALVAAPVFRSIPVVHDIEVDRTGGRLVLRQQLAQRSESGRSREEFDGGLIRGHDRAILGHGDLLRPEQHLGGARFHRRRIVSEDVPQQHLRELGDELRWHVDAFALEQADVGTLERIGADDTRPKAQPYAVIFPRVRIGQLPPARRLERSGGDWPAARRAARVRPRTIPGSATAPAA